MTRYLLDTNICIYIRQKRPQAVLKRFEKLTVGDAAISAITYGELVYGAERSPAMHREAYRKLLAELVEFLPVLPMPKDAGDAYGTLRESLERNGQVIGNNDLWIAAHAKAEGLTLVTNDEREFKRVHGLKTENWAN